MSTELLVAEATLSILNDHTERTAWEERVLADPYGPRIAKYVETHLFAPLLEECSDPLVSAVFEAALGTVTDDVSEASRQVAECLLDTFNPLDALVALDVCHVAGLEVRWSRGQSLVAFEAGSEPRRMSVVGLREFLRAYRQYGDRGRALAYSLLR